MTVAILPRRFAAVLLLALLLWGEAAPAQQAASIATVPQERQESPSDLTLSNFFSEGWDEPWVHRERSTPDMALLRVTTNFLEREFRLDYVHARARHAPKLDSTDFANALVAYGLNRRLMLEVIGNYQWNHGRDDDDGAGGGALARLQLVDTADRSYAAQLRVSPPNEGIGQTQTSMTYAVGGWQDLHALVPALDRVGLYGSMQYESLLGPHPAGARENDLSYDVSVARTWTPPTTPVAGDLTTFVEAFGTTDLDGAAAGATVFSLTPGVRFWPFPRNSLLLGVDLPVTSAPFSAAYRATYILTF